jgi:hypothetical protein
LKTRQASAAGKKKNLILVNAFYTNSILLRGLIEFLEDYFRVYFIDLPGFIRSSPSLEKISLENFSDHVRRRIEELRLDSFILGGISFGFLIINGIPTNGQCLGTAAILPYINASSLKLKPAKKKAYRLLVRFVLSFNLSQWVWNSRVCRRLATWYSVYPAERVDVIFDEMDGRTFFETARMILENAAVCNIQNRPTTLFLSRSDGTIDNVYVADLFRNKIRDLLIVNTEISHYPNRVDKKYFQERIPDADMKRMIEFYQE